MELLFTNSEELKQYLPYIDADITFENIILDANNSTKTIIKIIGKELYNSIYKLQQEDSESNKQLISSVAYPIAVDAYRNYVINNDVAHTNSGRRMRVSEHEKQAFEWMIDRDNKQLEKRYYKALDNMIETLDELNPLVKSNKNWKDSEEYKNTFYPLFRTTDEFNEYFEIESRYLLIKLIPGIKKCIQEEVIPRITESIWSEYFTALKENKSIPNQNILYHIKAACAYYSLFWASTRLSATILPEGILQNFVAENQTSQAKKVPDTNQFGVLKNVFEKDYKAELVKIENLIKPKINSDNKSISYEIDLSKNDKIIDI
ncbi:DUF6712 family protein [Chishuiella sp.]|uniref:DUF6712 family protein n=1 Tax=Chishuiella sp. TaxID=1969467 RepID=UPI0028A59B86|nr:DUF6712 family protein [Chishuiella sp.]